MKISNTSVLRDQPLQKLWGWGILEWHEFFSLTFPLHEFFQANVGVFFRLLGVYEFFFHKIFPSMKKYIFFLYFIPTPEPF